MAAGRRKMKGCVLIVVVMLCLCLTGRAGESLGQETLVIATSEHPPYTSQQPGEKSFLTEVLQEVGREMGVRFEFRYMPWRRCEQAVDESKVWGTVPYVRTPERDKRNYFSDVLYSPRALFFMYARNGKKAQVAFNTLSDLKGYRIGGVAGYYYERAFRDAGLNVEYVTSDEQNFQKLAARRVDLVAADEVMGWYLVRKVFPPTEVEHVYTLAHPLFVGDDHLMTSKGYPNTLGLLARFNSALKKVKEGGVYQRILDKYGIVLKY